MIWLRPAHVGHMCVCVCMSVYVCAKVLGKAGKAISLIAFPAVLPFLFLSGDVNTATFLQNKPSGLLNMSPGTQRISCVGIFRCLTCQHMDFLLYLMCVLYNRALS